MLCISSEKVAGQGYYIYVSLAGFETVTLPPPPPGRSTALSSDLLTMKNRGLSKDLRRSNKNRCRSYLLYQ